MNELNWVFFFQAMQQFKGVNDHFMALAGIYKIYVGILKLLQEDDLTENTRLKQSSWMKGTKNVKEMINWCRRSAGQCQRDGQKPFLAVCGVLCGPDGSYLIRRRQTNKDKVKSEVRAAGGCELLNKGCLGVETRVTTFRKSLQAGVKSFEAACCRCSRRRC